MNTQGVLPLGRGGTGNALSPVVGAVIFAGADKLYQTTAATAGAVAYGTGSVYAFTAAGTAGRVLLSNGTSAPAFGGIDGGTF